METKKVQPCGMLFTQGREYFLLHPHPIVKDWEGDSYYRFLVTPREKVNNDGSYSYARHIVTNNFAVEIIDVLLEIPILTEQEINNDR